MEPVVISHRLNADVAQGRACNASCADPKCRGSGGGKDVGLRPPPYFFLLFMPLIAASETGCALQRAGMAPEQIVQAIIDADNARDLDAAVGCYTDDVVWIAPNGDLVVGKNAVRESYRKMYGEFDVRLSGTIEEVEAGTTFAYVRGLTTGELSPRAGSERIRVHDRFLAIMRRNGEGWRVARLMWAPTK